MKRLLIISTLFLLASCASSEQIAYDATFYTCGVDNCSITAIHNHVAFPF